MRVIDIDSHVYESAAIWERYVEPKYHALARTSFWHATDEDGDTTVVLNGKAARPMNRSKLVRQALWRPGMTLDSIGAMDPNRCSGVNPGAQEPQARLKDMDALGIDAALLFPTLFAEYLPAVENPEMAALLARAYNDWLFDFCAPASNRLIPAAFIPLHDVSLAKAEVKRVAARGFKAAVLRPSFVNERFMNYRAYEPLWRQFEQLGLAVFVHPSPGVTNPEWTCAGPFIERVADYLKIGHDIAETAAPMMDAGTAFVAFFFCGHMEDYPKLKLAFAHAGASWVSLALEKVETFVTIMPGAKKVTLEPEEVFLERPSLIGFDAWEVMVPRMHDFYGPIAAWGSRYPHHDTSTPQEAMDNLRRWDVPEATIAQMMGGNAARFLGLM
jgi:predicted TIM-barrel fold metal-dependent hydrolase